ncbi:UDP binding domain-containing protein [Streptomyces sp. NPDC001389]|uniref:UDP binding domain-containing protein n=1 Tax=Streptomyces sp. NPDC001389 TaxID=3364569 RepID=UPI0036832753
MVERLEQGLAERGRPLDGATVPLLGLACKADSSDVRETPAAAVSELLTAKGAQAWAADLHVPDHRRTALGFRLHGPVEASAEVLLAADAVVLLAEHAAFDYGLITRTASYVLDCRGRRHRVLPPRPTKSKQQAKK